MQVSINQLYEWTGKDRRTIKRRLEALKPDGEGKFDSKSALEAIYFGNPSEDGEFISTPEAMRRLTIRKEEEILLDMEIKRKQRIPLDLVLTIFDEAQQSTAGILKSRKGKRLDEPAINEILAKFREMPSQLPSASHPA
jgi:hypothetical protein